MSNIDVNYKNVPNVKLFNRDIIPMKNLLLIKTLFYCKYCYINSEIKLNTIASRVLGRNIVPLTVQIFY